MEKKNTILLTVIAIATLLVAVVGATFAYFTATLTNEGSEANKTVNVTSKTLASVTYDAGSGISVDDALPGYKEVKSVTIKGSGEADSQAVNAVITVTPTIDPAFGNDISWKLYKSSTAITCTHSAQTTTGEYYDNASCVIPDGLTPVISGTTAAQSENITVAYNTNDTYYLVVEYANNTEAPQNTQQGKNFSVKIDVALAQ